MNKEFSNYILSQIIKGEIVTKKRAKSEMDKEVKKQEKENSGKHCCEEHDEDNLDSWVDFTSGESFDENVDQYLELIHNNALPFFWETIQELRERIKVLEKKNGIQSESCDHCCDDRLPL